MKLRGECCLRTRREAGFRAVRAGDPGPVWPHPAGLPPSRSDALPFCPATCQEGSNADKREGWPRRPRAARLGRPQGMSQAVPNRGGMQGNSALCLQRPHSARRAAAGGMLFQMTVDTNATGTTVTVNADPLQRHLGSWSGSGELAAFEDTRVI